MDTVFSVFPCTVGFITVLINFNKLIDCIKPVNAFYVGFYLSMFSVPNVDLNVTMVHWWNV
jgi:hypothetical protein